MSFAPDRAALRQLFEELALHDQALEAERAALRAAGHVCFPAIRRMHCWQCECGEVVEPKSVLAQIEEDGE